MRVSLNTVRQYTDINVSVDELAEKINRQLGAIEEIIDLGARYKDAVIVRVASCEKHPDADKLHVCLVDDAGVVADVPRNEGGFVQVVCGAPNVHEGMWAVWLPPRSIVPASFDDDVPFVLDARKLRGVLSQGMLAAGDELGINGDHDGIVEITEQDIPAGKIIETGVSFATLFGLDDTIIDIENKMFTHRPDLFGQLGVARELFAILQPESDETKHTDIRFKEPEWYWGMPQFESANKLPLETYNDAINVVPRFMAVVMTDVTIAPSPLWLQTELIRWGGKPINNVVDLTNYIMLLTAQPTHAYDYDKIRGHTLGARFAEEGETVELLNGKTYKLDKTDIVIADGEGAVGLAGIMGGGNSEVSADTKNIVLEVATFDMYAVRKSSMKYGLFTDALTRFNKGQSKLQNNRVLFRLMTLLSQYAGAIQASNVYDVNDFSSDTDPGTLNGEMHSSTTFINDRLGTSLTSFAIGNIVRRVNMAAFQPGDDEDVLSITAPFWRTDIELPEDIVEEVGRLYGYDKLPRELPKRSTAPAPSNTERERMKVVRERLARAGANELLTYSFVHQDTLKKAGQDSAYAYQLSNALSPDLQYYRLSLTPSLLDKVHMNSKAGYKQFALFEINKVHFKGEMDEAEPEVPNEDRHIALTIAGGDGTRQGSPYYAAREYLAQIMNIDDVVLQPLSEFNLATDKWGEQLVAPYEPKRSAVIARDNQIWGIVGEYKEVVRRAFKLPTYSAGFEVHQGVINSTRQAYQPLSRYPSTGRDVCFEVATTVPYSTITQAVAAELNAVSLQTSMAPIDIYQSESDTKRITMRMTFASNEKTLTNDEIAVVVNEIADSVAAKVGATII